MAVGSVRGRHQVTFAVLALGVGAFALLQSLVIPVLTTVQQELHTSQSAVTWVLTAYLLSASIFTPDPGPGRRHDRQGARLRGHAGRVGGRLAARRASLTRSA